MYPTLFVNAVKWTYKKRKIDLITTSTYVVKDIVKD